MLVPLQLIILVLPGSSLRGNRPDRTVDIILTSLDQPSAVANGIGILVFESLALFAIATIYGQIAAAWYAQTSISPAELLRAAAKRIPLIIGTWTITHIFIIAAGLLSFGALGVFLGVLFMLVAPVIGVESLSLGDSLKRSRELTMSKLGHSLIVFVIVAGAGQVMDVSIRFAPTFILQLVDVPPWITGGVFDVVASVIVVSFTAATAVVAYLDLRVRREGVDLYMATERSFAPTQGRG